VPNKTEAAQWVLRTDARPQVGFGHLARSMVLANALSIAAPVTIVVDDDAPIEELERDQDGVRIVHQVSFSPPRDKFNCMLDGYDFDDQAVAQWRQVGARLVGAISDEDTDERRLDFVISARPDCIANNARCVMTGLEYALVDPEFSRIASYTRNAPSTLLISMSARDGHNATARVLAALPCAKLSPDEDIQVVVALGTNAAHLESIRQAASDKHFQLHVDANMPPLLAAADLVIGGGGVGLLERMAAGRPSITIILSDNQTGQAVAAAEAGATEIGGSVDTLDPETLGGQIADLWSRPAKRQRLGRVGKNLIDGAGARRVADGLLALADSQSVL
jgi:spore coat polysaccharide biosynthesis predicted glycosyltransferase SpsG